MMDSEINGQSDRRAIWPGMRPTEERAPWRGSLRSAPGPKPKRRRKRVAISVGPSGLPRRLQSGHRLAVLDRRTGRPSPLRTTFRCAAPAICHSRRLPTQRRRRSDPSATSQTRSRPCDDASSSLSPGPSRDALVATPRSARHSEFPITDAVRLGGDKDG